MNTPPSDRPDNLPGPQPTEVNDEQVLAWIRLREEMSELHARLEYIKLMLKLGA